MKAGLKQVDNVIVEDENENGEVLAAGIAGEDAQMPLNPGKLVERLRDILKTIKISPIKSEFIRSRDPKERSVTLDPEHRWNATYQMIDRAIDLAQHIKAIMVDARFERDFSAHSHLSPFDWKALAEMKDLLEPMFELTEKISGSSYPTLGFALDGTERIRYSLRPSASDSDLIKKVFVSISPLSANLSNP